MAHPLKTFRAKNDLTLGDMAGRVGSSPATLSKIETGRQPVSPELAIAIEIDTKGEIKRYELRPDLWDAPSRAAE